MVAPAQAQVAVPHDHAGGGFVTLRSLLLGLVLCAISGLAAPHWTLYLQVSRLYADYHAAGVTVSLLVALVLFNVLLRLVSRRFALSVQELAITSGTVAYLIPAMVAPYHLHDASNDWANALWPNIPSRLVPLDLDGKNFAIEKFWAGLPPGEPIPWTPWIEPLILWGIFFVAMFACMLAIMVIMRKQWVDYEHLSFPVAQIPAEVCSVAEPGSRGGILRSRAFWIGLAITFCAGSASGIADHFGKTFSFHIAQTATLGPEPWELDLRVHPVILGLAYLVPNRVVFSVWFMSLASWATRSFMTEYNLALPTGSGYYGTEFDHLAMGATLVFVASSLWLARGHLKRSALCALRLGEKGYDQGEASSYTMAMALLVLGFVGSTAWLVWAGLDWYVSLATGLITLIVYYAMARVVAQCGMPVLSPPIVPSTYAASLFGTSYLGTQQIGVLGLHFGWHFDIRNSPMAGSVHGMYLARRRRGGLLLAMGLGLAVCYVTATASSVWVGYRHGAVNCDPYFFGIYPRWIPWHWAHQAVNAVTAADSGPSFVRMVWAAVGAALMALLVTCHRSFFWWPLHPVGLLIVSSHMVYYFWFTIFVAWLIKLFVVWGGGYAAYRVGRRFFIGIVMGSFVAGGVWNVIDTLMSHTTNPVFYI
jgi:hypothetical protein